MDRFSESSLPTYCQPTSPFLEHISRLFSTCIPTPASFISSTFGFLSITAWLFAQLPQIYKNYKNGSVEGLSLLFLLNWLLGDVCNLGGTILLNQMFFQKFIGGYYIVVDMTLMAQWIWYSILVGKRTKLGYEFSENKADYGNNNEAMDIIEGHSPPGTRDEDRSVKGVGIKKVKKSRYDTSFPGTPSIDTPPIGTPGSSRWNVGSGKTTVQTCFVFVTLFALAFAYPEGGSEHTHRRGIAVSSFMGPGVFVKSSNMENLLTKDFIGGVIAWISAALYCSSRIPQLLKNHSRRSCSGLSITLFIAAFFGNLFYSLSLLSNPLAWGDYESYGGGGLAGPEGSKAREWWGNSLPFFLGASGVLCTDAMIFCQFLIWGEKEPVAIEEEGEVENLAGSLFPLEGSLESPWRRWIPSISIEVKEGAESTRLLDNTEEVLGLDTQFEDTAGARTGYGTIP